MVEMGKSAILHRRKYDRSIEGKFSSQMAVILAIQLYVPQKLLQWYAQKLSPEV